MPSEQDLIELIVLDLAVEAGDVPAVAVAAVLAGEWGTASSRRLSDALAEAAGLDETKLEDLRRRATELVGDAGGSAAAALAIRAGLHGAIHDALRTESGGDEVSKSLSRVGAHARVLLRTLPQQRYRDYSLLGQGGMGVVFLAVDTELNRQVAIKLIRPQGAAEPGSDGPFSLQEPAIKSALREHYEALKARFLQEAWVTGNLEHPGIVPIYELGRTPAGVPYYAMRYVTGARTLRDAIRAAAPEPFEARLKGLEFLLKACDAIGFAHSRGVVHRDIKPDNVALGDHGEVVVLDWGLAKVADTPDLAQTFWREQLEAHRDATSLETGTQLIGTPGYLPPEAALGDVDAIDARSDVYCLGVIFFEILTGRRPFEFESPIDYCLQINKHAAPRADVVDTRVPAGLADICASALSQVPGDRPDDAGALATLVRNWQAHSQIEREVAASLTEARGALADAKDATDTGVLVHVDRVLHACALIARRQPRHDEARSLQAEAEALRESGLASAGRARRRRLLVRIGVGLLVVAAGVAILVAAALDKRRRETERQQHEKALALDTGLAAVIPLQVELLWPVHPDEAPKMAATLEQAHRLNDAIPAYRRKLEALRRAAQPDPEGRPRYASSEARRLADSLEALVRDLPPLFVEPDGALARLARRHEIAETLEHVSIVANAEAWTRAADEVAKTRIYGGYVLTPQLGLVPLGADPESTLQEFAHIGSGTVPTRDPNTGTLDLAEDAAIVLVLLPPGTYWRGAQAADPDGQNYDPETLGGEGPVHRVDLTRPYLIGKYEVTQAQWKTMSEGAQPSRQSVPERYGGKAVTWRNPVESVSWHQCQELATRHRLTLPEHSRWEYACRGGMLDGVGYPYGVDLPADRLGEIANLFDRQGKRTWSTVEGDYSADVDDGHGGHAPVGSYRANPFGLHDMLGNIGEWVLNVAGYNEFPDNHAVDPVPTDTPEQRVGVTCGGSYFDPARACRVSMRSWPTRDSASPSVGARFAAVVTD